MENIELVSGIAGWILRIGVPALVTGMIAYMLKRLDNRWADAGMQEPAFVTLRTGDAPIVHCWEARNCPPHRRDSCAGYKNSSDQPCWKSFEKNGKMQEACLTCSIRRSVLSLINS